MSKWSPLSVRLNFVEIECAEYKLVLEEVARLILSWRGQKQNVPAALDTPKLKEIKS